MRVLLGNVLARIEHQHHHVGVLDRLQGLDDGEFFHRLEHLATTPHAGGVDQDVGFAVALEFDINRIARGARLVERDHAFLAHQRVDQRRLADVGAPHQRDLGDAEIVGFFFLFGKRRQRLGHQIGNAVAVRAGNGQRLAQRQFVKLGGDHGGVHALGLVDREQHRTRRTAQAVGDDLVLRRQACPCIDHENDGVGLVDGLQRLPRHFGHDAVLGDRLQTARVDHQIGLFTEAPAPVMAVARHPRQVVHQRIARAGETVEEGGLADVGPADKNQGGEH